MTGIKRYNVMVLSSGFYINDPDTMTASRVASERTAYEACKLLNAGIMRRDDLDWMDF